VRYQDPLTIQRVLHTARTIAIVGLSNNELRASHFVGYYLKRHGYRVIPVNPRESEILGETCYASLLDVPVPVDIVDVFRAPDALPGIARDASRSSTHATWAGCTGSASTPSASRPSAPGSSSCAAAGPGAIEGQRREPHPRCGAQGTAAGGRGAGGDPAGAVEA